MYELGDVIEFSFSHGMKFISINSTVKVQYLIILKTSLEPEYNHHGLIIGIVTGENGKSLGSYLVSGIFEN